MLCWRLQAWCCFVSHVVRVAAGPGTSGSTINLQGAGATFPNPLLSEVAQRVRQAASQRAHRLSVNWFWWRYQTNKRTDSRLWCVGRANERRRPESAHVGTVHVPTVLGAVVLTYNLQGNQQPLRFSPDVIADIFLGKITKWNDRRIKADNPDVNLPASGYHGSSPF